MDLLNDIRLTYSPRALHRSMALIMRKHLLLLLTLHLSDVSLLWLSFAIGFFIRWIWRMLSSIETLRKKCTCNHALAILIWGRQFVIFVVLFMASSNLLGYGLKSLAQLLLSKVSLRVLTTLLSSFEEPLLVSLLFFFMLMSWLLLEMTLQIFAFFDIFNPSLCLWMVNLYRMLLITINWLVV